MCCTGVNYSASEVGHTGSYNFALSEGVWNVIVVNNYMTTDGYADPYSSSGNPVTGEKWNFKQISTFLRPYNIPR